MKDQLDNLISTMRDNNLTLKECAAIFRRQWIVHVLEKHRGNRCKAARELGMHRNTMSRSIEHLQIDVRQLRRAKPKRVASVRDIREVSHAAL